MSIDPINTYIQYRPKMKNLGIMTIDKSDGTTPLAVSSNNPLEQFVLLAKGTKGVACAELIKQVLEAPGVHVFGELLDMPNIKELEDGPYAAHYKTLNLFAYGTYKDYLRDKTKYIELTQVQCKKLQHLTIVTLGACEKCIPYSSLLEELDMKNVRQLEDLIIEAIYADIIHGKLDQKYSRLEVDYTLGRDARPEEVDSILAVLMEWCDSCDAVLACVDTQIQRANAEKQRRTKHKDSIEQEIVNIKKTLKAQAEVEDSVGGAGSSDMYPSRNKKPNSKGKSTRGSSGKFWQKTT